MDINASDTTFISENVGTSGSLNPSVADNVDVIDGYRSMVDNVAVSESQSIQVGFDIFQTDTTNTSEFVGHYPDQVAALEETEVVLLNPFSRFETELVIVSESVTVSAPQHPFASVWNNIIRIRTKNF